ncbi:hypothetical protein U27_01598 [Candidatus Vecturithrix granuli]|uniref:Uncharacterized protein n=1 Tax=Vecturithrix granuli TaxID=1499967 RepID=A0A0S6W569_VECG1|nr:hypothetical protein U27_01598 [Candidatus Vecturithrix granuli]
MKHIAVLVIVIALLGGAASANQITTLSESSGAAIHIEVLPGERWTHQGKMLLFKFDVTPQIAVWIEDLHGNYLDTLYVTQKFAKQEWGGVRGQDKDKTFRSSSLPYWNHKRMEQGLASPTKNAPLPDAVTAASPTQKQAFSIVTKANTDLTEIAVLMEVNNSFDENEHYSNKPKEAAAEYNGQPAVIYRAMVNLAQPGTYAMQLIGHASWTGETDDLIEDLSTLTSAVCIIEKAVVIVE